MHFQRLLSHSNPCSLEPKRSFGLFYPSFQKCISCEDLVKICSYFDLAIFIILHLLFGGAQQLDKEGAVYGPYADSGAVTEHRLEGADLSRTAQAAPVLASYSSPLCCCYKHLPPPTPVLTSYFYCTLQPHRASVLGSFDAAPLHCIDLSQPL